MRSSDQLFTGTEVMSFTALEYTHSTTKRSASAANKLAVAP